MKKLTTCLTAILTVLFATSFVFGATLRVTDSPNAKQYIFQADPCMDSDSTIVTPPAYSALYLGTNVSSSTGTAEGSVSGPAGSVSAFSSGGGTDSDGLNVNTPGSGGSYLMEVYLTNCAGHAVAIFVAYY